MTTRILVFGMLLTTVCFFACDEEAALSEEERTTVVAGPQPTLSEVERAAAEKSERMAAEAEAKMAAAAKAAEAEAEAVKIAAAEAADEAEDYRKTEAYKKASAERRRKRHEKRRLERERKEREAAAAERPAEYVQPTAAPTSTLSGASGMRFQETIHSFEPIDEGDKVTHAFKFTNTGTAPLEITNAEVSCGCTYPSYPFLPIAPGESGEITVTFNSKGKFGKQKPIVTIYTNTPEKQYKLMMEGEVITEVAKKKDATEVPEKG